MLGALAASRCRGHEDAKAAHKGQVGHVANQGARLCYLAEVAMDSHSRKCRVLRLSWTGLTHIFAIAKSAMEGSFLLLSIEEMSALMIGAATENKGAV